jgi:hypothetical protein
MLDGFPKMVPGIKSSFQALKIKGFSISLLELLQEAYTTQDCPHANAQARSLD